MYEDGKKRYLVMATLKVEDKKREIKRSDLFYP